MELKAIPQSGTEYRGRRSRRGKKIFPVVLIVFLSLIPLTWFRDGCLINGGDLSFPFSLSKEYFSQAKYTWNDKIGLGISNTQGLAQIPLQSFLFILNSLGFSLQEIEKIFFVLILLIAGISMYYMSETIFSNSNNLRNFLCAIFYMFNPYTMIVVWRMLTFSIIFYAFLPLLVLLFCKLMKKFSLFNFFCFNFLSIIASSSGNPVLFLLLWFILFSYMVLLEQSVKTLTKKFALLLLSCIIFNSFWILPVAVDIPGGYAKAVNSYIDGTPFDTFGTATSAADLIEVFKLRGYWPFYTRFLADSYYGYNDIYFTPLFILFSFLIPIIAFSSLIWKEDSRNNKLLVLFLSISSVILIFFLKGIKPPLGKAFFEIVFAIPFTGILRNPIDKIGLWLLFSYSLIFGYGLAQLYNFIENKTRKKIVIGLILVIIFVFYLFPFWTGEVIYDGDGKMPSYHTKVPDYYNKAAEWLRNEKEQYRIFPYPYIEQYFGIAYKWGAGYLGSNPAGSLFPGPVVCNTEHKLPQIMATKLDLKDRDVFIRLGKMSVKYILLCRDFSFEYHSYCLPYPKTHYLNLLESEKKDIKLKKKFGDLEFYEIKKELVYPYIYLTDKLDTDNGCKVSYPKFTKINPTKYVVDININSPAYLVLNQQYHPRWKAYVEGKELAMHLETNGFANAYYIDKIGNFKITIKYMNQNVYNAGIIISILAIIISFFLCIFIKI